MSKGTEILIRLWGDDHEKQDQHELAMEHVLGKIKEGYTSGHELNAYWAIREQQPDLPEIPPLDKRTSLEQWMKMIAHGIAEAVPTLVSSPHLLEMTIYAALKEAVANGRKGAK